MLLAVLLAGGVPLLRSQAAPTPPIVSGSPSAIGAAPDVTCAPRCAGFSPALSTEAWTNVSASQWFDPGALRGASLVFDRADNEVVAFGGCSPTACPAPSATWQFSGGTWSNLTSESPQPPARTDAALTFDSHDGYVLLFGGWAGPGRALNDTWSFAGGIWTNLTNVSAAPPARWGASAAYDRTDAYVALFGGTNGTSTLNDTWRYAGGNWKNVSGAVLSGPSPRSYAGFAWDDADGLGVLFGGQNATGAPLNDTWTFLHARWTIANLSPNLSPPARTQAVFSYYGQDNAVYLFGGRGVNGPLADTWRYAQSRWVNDTLAIAGAPSARIDAASFESSVAWTTGGVKVKLGFLLVFGGGSTACAVPCAGSPRMDTWIFELPPQTTAAALPSVAEVGQPTVFSATASAGTPPYLYTWQLGDGSSSSAASPTHSYATAGTFTAVVTVTDFAGVTTNATADVMVVGGPSVTAVATPSVLDVGRAVSFTASTAGGTSPYTVHWDFGDLVAATGATATHTYALPGVFHGNVTVDDAVFGVGIATFIVTVNPDLAFTSTVPSGPIRNGTVAGFAANVTGGTPPYAEAWTFGDGASSSGALVNHSFAAPGNYTVGLTITDATGANRSANYTVTVTGPPPGPTPTNPPPPNPLSAWALWIVLVGAVVAIAVVLVFRRRLHRRAPEQLIAAAAVGQGVWTEEDPENRADSRSARRAGRSARRWP